MGGTVSKSAICRAAGLAAGRPVVVVAIAAAGGRSVGLPQSAPVPTRAVREQVRRTVAEAMSAVEALGATALGHIAVTRSPGRTLVRLARTRGARAVVLDGSLAAPAAGRGGSDLAVELRRRVHGSGLIVEAAASERRGSGGDLGPAVMRPGREPVTSHAAADLKRGGCSEHGQLAQPDDPGPHALAK